MNHHRRAHAIGATFAILAFGALAVGLPILGCDVIEAKTPADTKSTFPPTAIACFEGYQRAFLTGDPKAHASKGSFVAQVLDPNAKLPCFGPDDAK